MGSKSIRTLVRPAWVALNLGLALVMASCQGSPSGPELYPVRGKVLYHGEPAVGARVMFHPRHDPDLCTAHPAGIVAADGSFALTSCHPGDGAPVGDYTVAVVWPAETASAAEIRGIGRKQPFNDRLQGRYSDPSAPLLQAEVRAGDNELPPFELR